MSGTNPTSTFTLTNFNTQNSTQYKSNIDGNFAVSERIVDAFAPHAQASPNMTIRLDPGSVWNGTTLTELDSQNTATIVAPVSNPRIDRVVVSRIDGTISVITGVEAGSPTAPAFTANSFPVAQILLQTSSVIITNSMITDERNFSGTGPGIIAVNTYTTAGTDTWNKPTGLSGNALVYIQVWGAGGSGESGNSNFGGGGGGSYKDGWFVLSTFGSTVTVTVGTGGAAVTNGYGNGGTASSFGTFLIGYGGSGGGGSVGTHGEGGGGGGWFSNTTTQTNDVPTGEGIGGDYNGGGGAPATTGYFVGGGGGIGNQSPLLKSNGANSVYGGGGGASGGGTQTGGTSQLGGAGGGTTGGVASPGTQPGGGGGGVNSAATASGKGGDGKVIVTVFNG